ncbi:MAG: amino acid ABC transporter permease [Candidatus Melainabacteria bacterium]
MTLLLKGLLTTVAMAGIVAAGGLLMGALLALLRTQAPKPVRWLCAAFIETLRGIPLILWLLGVHYGLMPLVLAQPDSLLSMGVGMTLFEAVYFAEIIRGGLAAIRTEERDSALSLGFSAQQAWTRVLLPLALRRMTPALTNQVITLIKDTSLASIISVVDFTRAGEILYEQTHNELPILLAQAAVYFSLCWAVAKTTRRWELG